MPLSSMKEWDFAQDNVCVQEQEQGQEHEQDQCRKGYFFMNRKNKIIKFVHLKNPNSILGTQPAFTN